MKSPVSGRNLYGPTHPLRNRKLEPVEEPLAVAENGQRSQLEDHVQRLHPSVRYVWWVEGGLVALPVVVAGAVLAVVLSGTGWQWLWVAPVAVALAAATLAVVVPIVRYRNWAYALREDDLWIRSGVFWRRTTIIPYIRLQFVDTKQGPIERLLDLSQLIVHTAAVGTSGQVPGLSNEAANALRERLSRLEGDTGGL